MRRETLVITLVVLLIGAVGYYMTNTRSTSSEEKGTVKGESGSGLEEVDPPYPYTVEDTGQDKCYDTSGNKIECPAPGEPLYGQDAQYQGYQPKYRDNGDGTVTDLTTGLMWQQVPPTEEFTWEEANEYCENLNLAGYDDWRLPSVKELFSLWNGSEGWPYIDTKYFKLVYQLTGDQITKDEQYWTSTKYVGVTVEGGNNAAFGVNFATGHIKAYPAGSQPQNGTEAPSPPKMGNETQMPPMPPAGQAIGNSPLKKYVRCVRGNPDYGKNDFVDNGDGTITDRATGLMWTKNDSGYCMNWEEALEYVQKMNEQNYLGYSDWRLPNVKELLSIVDYKRAPDASDPSHQGPAIDPIFNVTPIINEAGELDYPYYWTSTSARMHSGEPMYYAWYVAFGRAVNNEGLDFHGAGAVRFDTKVENGPAGEGGERICNFVRLVRDANSTQSVTGGNGG
jgi:hypothetical protein